MRCPICDDPSPRIRARPAPWTFLECGACRVFFVDPMPTGDAVENAGEHYTEVYYGAAEPRPDEDRWSAATADASDRRIARIQRAFGRPGRFLDVGTGTGALLGAAARAGWDARGVEVSARAAASASATYGVPVTVGTVADADLEDDSIDATSLTHVLEHVPDPIALLRDLRRILSSDGILNVAVPNARGMTYAAYNLWHRARRRYGVDRFSCGLYPPDHLYAFDTSSLTSTLARAGFRVRSMTITGKGDPEHYPVVSWRGSGPTGHATRIIEFVGRKSGRGSIIDCIASPTEDPAEPTPG